VTRITLIGNVNVDLIVRSVEELPPPGSERAVDAIETRVGGAAAIAGLTLAGLGVAARVIGCVGDDLFGGFLRAELASTGVDVTDLRIVDGAASGISIALEAPGRDRSFLTSMGALARLDLATIPDDALEADIVLVGGYFLAPRLRGEPTAALLRRAKEHGATTLLDTGWDPDDWPATTRAEIEALLPLADVLLPNADEAAGLTGIEDDPRASALALAARSSGRVVVKLGARGCVAVDADRSLREIEAPAVTALDATGAGDAFDAGLIAGLAEGLAFADALRFATRVGSTVVARPSSSRYPSRDQLVASPSSPT
jgi:sugar/nucleoside kinase (ribokinase family)